MDDSNIIKVTPKQAKKQFSILAYGLIVYGIVMVSLQFIQSYIINNYLDIFTGVSIEYLTIGITIIGIILATFIPFPIIQKVIGIKTADFTRKNHMSYITFLGYVSICIAINLFGTFLAVILETLFKSNAAFVTPIGVFNGQYVITNPLYIVMILLVTPICEEYIFRGVCLRTLGRYGNRFALFAVALLYAAAHGNLLEAIPAFFFGIALTLVTLRYKSIKPTIGIHIINNLFFYITEIIPTNMSWIVGVAVFVVYALAIFIIIIRQENRVIIRKETDTYLLWKLFLTSIPVIISFLLFLTSSIIKQFIG